MSYSQQEKLKDYFYDFRFDEESDGTRRLFDKAYLEGRYGAIPIFQSFTYDKED